MLQWYTSIYYTQLLGASNTNSLDLREIKLGHKTVHLSILNEFRLNHGISVLDRGVNKASNFKVHLKKPSPSPLIEQNIWGQTHSKIYLFVGLKKPHYKGKKKVFLIKKSFFFPVKNSFFH